MNKIFIIIVIFLSYTNFSQDIVNPNIQPSNVQAVDTIIASIKEIIKNRSNLKNITGTDLNKAYDSLIEKSSKDLVEAYKQPNIDKRNVYSLFGVFGKKLGKVFWGEGEEKPKSILLTTSTSDVRGSLYTDLVTDYIDIVRVTFAASVTASKTDTSALSKEKDDIQSFFAGGGNAILKLDLPLLYLSNLNPLEPEKYNSRSLAIYFMPRISMTLPSLGSSLTEPSGLGELGIEVQFRLLTDKKFFGISGRVRYGYVISSKELAKNLVNDDKNVFPYGVGSIVLNIKNFGIYINFPISFSFDKANKRNYPIDRAPVTISLSQIF